MKGECPNCGAVYKIDDSKIPDKGGYGRCPRCQTRFFIMKEFSSQHQLMHCPRCRRDVESSNFCSNCGFDFWDIKGGRNGKKDFVLALKKQVLNLKKPGIYLLRSIVHIAITGGIFLLTSGLIILTLLTIAELGAESEVTSLLKDKEYILIGGSIFFSWMFYNKFLRKVVSDLLDKKLG
jgi:predicted Zn finger-like uncharacterized protein